MEGIEHTIELAEAGDAKKVKVDMGCIMEEDEDTETDTVLFKATLRDLTPGDINRVPLAVSKVGWVCTCMHACPCYLFHSNHFSHPFLGCTSQ